jgi:hypothetical protein
MHPGAPDPCAGFPPGVSDRTDDRHRLPRG